MKTDTYPSKGVGSLCTYRWEPSDKPVGVVQIVHGIAEYAARYEEFAQFLTEKGFLVVAEDHMGHGHSVGGMPLWFSGGWTTAVDDVYALTERTRAEFPDLPYFMFGHSMGSFLTRTLLYRYPQAGLCGAILCGTAWQPLPVLCAGRALCALERRRVGAKGHSKLLTKLIFGAYNAKFPDAKTPHDWICTRREVVDRYAADPLCGGEATVGLSGDMLGGMAENQKRKNLNAMPQELPVLFLAGKSDPVGNMGKGVRKTAERFRASGMRDVTLRLYEGRHEILNEPVRETVRNDIWEFLQRNS